jgi:hypothetical protein
MNLRVYVLASVTISLLLIGCNNSVSSPGSVQAATGYSNATVTGHYATAINGIIPLSNGSFAYFGIMAHVVSTGAGTFTGSYDAKFHNYMVGGGSYSPSECDGTITSGTYSIGSNGDGQASLTFSPTTPSSVCAAISAGFEISTTAAGDQIALAEIDGTATSSGTGILQQ